MSRLVVIPFLVILLLPAVSLKPTIYFTSPTNSFSHFQPTFYLLQELCHAEWTSNFNLVLVAHLTFKDKANCSSFIESKVMWPADLFPQELPYSETDDEDSFDFSKFSHVYAEEFHFFRQVFMQSTEEDIAVIDSFSFGALAAANEKGMKILSHAPTTLFDVSYPCFHVDSPMFDFLLNPVACWLLYSSRKSSFKDIIAESGQSFSFLSQADLHVRYSTSWFESTEDWRHPYMLQMSPIFYHTHAKGRGNGILISFGSALHPREKLQKIVSDSLRQIPSKKVWISQLPLLKVTEGAGIHEVRWSNQRELLCSGDFGVFITHGGHNSIIDALYCGVPIVVIPLNFDQFDNARRVVKEGYGHAFARNNRNSTELALKLTSLLSNPPSIIQDVSNRLQQHPLGQVEAATALQKLVFGRSSKSPVFWLLDVFIVFLAFTFCTFSALTMIMCFKHYK